MVSLSAQRKGRMMKSIKKRKYVVAIPVYTGVNLIDMSAPREVFYWMGSWGKSIFESVDIYFVGDVETVYETETGVRFMADVGYDDSNVKSPDLIWVPGGNPAVLSQMVTQPDLPFFSFIKRVAPHCEYVCSVCEGAILLASTGLLDGHDITTHWLFVNCFAQWPAVRVVPGNPRYVKSGNRVTGGGISSGFDEALYLVELIAGTEMALQVQQAMQYYPRPPVDGPLPAASVCPVNGLA